MSKRIALASLPMTGRGSTLIVAPGSQPARQALGLAVYADRMAELDQILAVVTTDFDNTTLSPAYLKALAKRHPRVVRKLLLPSRGLNGLQAGFLGEYTSAQQTRAYWEPILREQLKLAVTRAAQLGSPVSTILLFLSPWGGHEAVTEAALALLRKPDYFGRATIIGILNIPSDDRRLRRNVLARPTYPLDLGIPLIVSDNAHRAHLDHALAAGLASLLTARQSVTRGGGQQYANLLHGLYTDEWTGEGLIGLSSAALELPLVAHKRGQALNRDLVVELGGVALAAALDPANRLVAAAPTPPEVVQVLSLTGLPIPAPDPVWQERDGAPSLGTAIEDEARTQAGLNHLPWPAACRPVFAPSTPLAVEGDPTRILLRAHHFFPIHESLEDLLHGALHGPIRMAAGAGA